MKWFLLVVAVLVLVAAGAVYALLQSNQSSNGPLNGMRVSKVIANRRPIAVTIDDFVPDARPQSGMQQASLVMETLAEGGITRFMAVYLENDAGMIGPMRSTRLYFNHWAAGLGVIFGHDGGNVDALQELPSLQTIYNEDSDKIGQINGPFWRISSRAIPHNEYTSTVKLRAYAQARGEQVTGSLTVIPHKDDAALSQRPTQPAILHVQFSYGAYNIEWQYDRVGNDYLRYAAGTSQVDGQTGKQLTAKNVIVMFVRETPGSDPFTPGAIRLATEGTGKAIVYQDGRDIQGTWSKPTTNSPLQWLDSNGNSIPLNRGNSWVEVVPTGNSVYVSGKL